MKNKFILSSLVGIITTSIFFNVSAMSKKKEAPALPPAFYTSQAKTYIQNFKDSNYCRQNLVHKLDWFKDIKKGKVRKVDKIVTCRDPQSKKIVGFGVKTGEYKLSDIQKHINIVVNTILAHKNSEMGNVLYNYHKNLKTIFKLSIFKQIGNYCGKKLPLYDKWKLTPVNPIIFKKLFSIFGNFKNFRAVFLAEAIHFTQTCLQELENQNLSNKNSGNSSSDDSNNY